MKTLEFIYQETQIHFLINPTDENVMVNATEMAKLFNKEVRSFLRLEGTKLFVKALIEKENTKQYNIEDVIFDRTHLHGQKQEKDIFYTTNKATFMHKKLALKFAAWLDVRFEIWVFDIIDSIINGNAKDFNQAVYNEKNAKNAVASLKLKLISDPTHENVTAFFDNEEKIKAAQGQKNQAVKNQLSLFKEMLEQKKPEAVTPGN